MAFTAPYGDFDCKIEGNNKIEESITTSFNQSFARSFISNHGLGVRAICIQVDDVFEAHSRMINNGAKSVLDPVKVDIDNNGHIFSLAEVEIYGDVVLRLIDRHNVDKIFLPNYKMIPSIETEVNPFAFLNNCSDTDSLFGLKRFDHIVGNLWSLQPTVQILKQVTVSFYR